METKPTSKKKKLQTALHGQPSTASSSSTTTGKKTKKNVNTAHLDDADGDIAYESAMAQESAGLVPEDGTEEHGPEPEVGETPQESGEDEGEEETVDNKHRPKSKTEEYLEGLRNEVLQMKIEMQKAKEREARVLQLMSQRTSRESAGTPAQKGSRYPLDGFTSPGRVHTPATRSMLGPDRDPRIPRRDARVEAGEDDQHTGSVSSPPVQRRQQNNTPDMRSLLAAATLTKIELPKVRDLTMQALVQNASVLYDWQFDVEKRITVTESNNGQALTFSERFLVAKQSMDRGVTSFLNAYLAEADAGNCKRIMCWEDLIQVLEEQYQPARDSELARDELRRLAMNGGESMEAFLIRASNILARIPAAGMPTHIAAEEVIACLDKNRWPVLLREVNNEQRIRRSDTGGIGLTFNQLRMLLPTLALAEPPRQGGGGASAAEMAAAIAAEVKKQINAKTAKPSGQRVNAVATGRTDEELKAKNFDERTIKLYRSNLCFNCEKPGHTSRQCTEPKRPRDGASKK